MSTTDKPEFDAQASYPVSPRAVAALSGPKHRDESDVEDDILKLCKARGACQFKHGKDGWPDRVVCYKGFFIGVEVKSTDPSKKLTVRQNQRLTQIKLAGGVGIMARASGDVAAVFDRIDARLRELDRKPAPSVLPGQLSFVGEIRADDTQSPVGFIRELHVNKEQDDA